MTGNYDEMEGFALDLLGRSPDANPKRRVGGFKSKHTRGTKGLDKIEALPKWKCQVRRYNGNRRKQPITLPGGKS